MIGCRGQGRFEPNRKSDFTTELVRESGRLRELPQLGAVAAPPQAGSPGRVGSRRDPSDGQVSLVVDFTIPLLRRGAWAFIITVTGYPYLNLVSSLLLTISLHLITSSVVLAARRATAAEGCRSCPLYLC
ncbi:hypothetical protein B296_00048762 [Ensete ventricosum]|uniref:Uncharacterized protein n=1 Tax=Ensete ventricosum TaxID=4639 RepID=A0A426X4X5_ENSVE|nr:hypothetical protein B296_00048762 [Ensete ventricosum]